MGPLLSHTQSVQVHVNEHLCDVACALCFLQVTIDGPPAVTDLNTVRLSGSIACQNPEASSSSVCTQDAANFYYRWSELNHNLLSQPQVQAALRTNLSVENLVLDAGVLLPGEEYAFQLSASRAPFVDVDIDVDAGDNDGVGIGHGVFFVGIRDGPTITNFDVGVLPGEDSERLVVMDSDASAETEGEELTTVYRLSASAYNPSDVDAKFRYRFGYFLDDESGREYPLTSYQEDLFADGACSFEFMYRAWVNFKNII